jgi:hypothetical protein
MPYNAIDKWTLTNLSRLMTGSRSDGTRKVWLCPQCGQEPPTTNGEILSDDCPGCKVALVSGTRPYAPTGPSLRNQIQALNAAPAPHWDALIAYLKQFNGGPYEAEIETLRQEWMRPSEANLAHIEAHAAGERLTADEFLARLALDRIKQYVAKRPLLKAVVDGDEAPKSSGLKLNTEAKAVAVLTDHPDWTNKDIAEHIGCHPKTLSRLPLFKAARGFLKEAHKKNVARGSKWPSDGGGVDAWDANDDVDSASDRALRPDDD